MTTTTDTEYVHDSVFVYVGDTVFVTRWRTAWRERTVHDTVLKHTTDTVFLTQTVDKVTQVPSEGSTTGWIVALALFAVIVVYMLIKVRLKYK